MRRAEQKPKKKRRNIFQRIGDLAVNTIDNADNNGEQLDDDFFKYSDDEAELPCQDTDEEREQSEYYDEGYDDEGYDDEWGDDEGDEEDNPENPYEENYYEEGVKEMGTRGKNNCNSMIDYLTREEIWNEQDPTALSNRKGLPPAKAKKAPLVRRDKSGRPLFVVRLDVRFKMRQGDNVYVALPEMLRISKEEYGCAVCYHAIGLFDVYEDGVAVYNPAATTILQASLKKSIERTAHELHNYLVAQKQGRTMIDKKDLTVKEVDFLKKQGIDVEKAPDALIAAILAIMPDSPRPSETIAASQESTEKETGWTCPKCGKDSTGNFCSECGIEKPVPEDTSEWTCPGCGKENTGKFCSGCGTKRPEVIKECPHCHAEILDPKSKFCPHCAKLLRPESTDEGDGTPEGTSKTGSGKQGNKPNTEDREKARG